MNKKILVSFLITICLVTLSVAQVYADAASDLFDYQTGSINNTSVPTGSQNSVTLPTGSQNAVTVPTGSNNNTTVNTGSNNSFTVPTGGGTQLQTLENPLKNVNSIGALVENFVQIFSYIAVIFAVLALVYVGLRFVLIRGDTSEMNKLKDWLLYIVIGVAIIIGARVIIHIVINTLSATGTVDQGVINSANNALKTK